MAREEVEGGGREWQRDLGYTRSLGVCGQESEEFRVR